MYMFVLTSNKIACIKDRVDKSLLKILILYEIFLVNLLRKFTKKDFFLLFFLRILIGR